MEERHRECTSAQRVLSAQSRFARRKFAQQICMHAYGSGLVHTEGRHVKDGERGFAGVNEHPPDVTLSWMIMKCWARVGTDRRWIDTATARRRAPESSSALASSITVVRPPTAHGEPHAEVSGRQIGVTMKSQSHRWRPVE